MDLEEQEGRCDAVVNDARRFVLLVPQGGDGYRFLATALAGAGQPRESVREAITLAVPRLAKARQARYELFATLHLDLLHGDFEAVEAALPRARALVAKESYDALHARFAILAAQLYLELDRPRDAAEAARDYLARHPAWQVPPKSEDSALYQDPSAWLLAVQHRGGLLSRAHYEARRAAWLAAWEASLPAAHRGYLWVRAFVEPADTAEDAKAALAAYPRYAPLQPFFPFGIVDGDVGRVHLLAGDARTARPLLERATKNCRLLEEPVAATTAHYSFGLALEALSDREGACRAYGVVLERWGRASSSTAKKARARSKALACDAAAGPR
jgi:serine/threonine-protein kinase